MILSSSSPSKNKSEYQGGQKHNCSQCHQFDFENSKGFVRLRCAAIQFDVIIFENVIGNICTHEGTKSRSYSTQATQRNEPRRSFHNALNIADLLQRFSPS